MGSDSLDRITGPISDIAIPAPKASLFQIIRLTPQWLMCATKGGTCRLVGDVMHKESCEFMITVSNLRFTQLQKWESDTTVLRNGKTLLIAVHNQLPVKMVKGSPIMQYRYLQMCCRCLYFLWPVYTSPVTRSALQLIAIPSPNPVEDK